MLKHTQCEIIESRDLNNKKKYQFSTCGLSPDFQSYVPQFEGR